MRLLKKLFEIVRAPAALTGSLLGVSVFALAPGGTGAVGLVVGWLYGVVVGALLRLFPVPLWTYPVLGVFVGPVPLAFFIGKDVGGDARGVVVIGIPLGVLIGFVEWAVARQAARAEPRPLESS